MTKKSTVTRLSTFNANVLSVSPEQAIQDFQDFLQANPEFDKVFLLAAKTKNNNFSYSWFKGRMLCSEAIVALELAIQDQLEKLRDE
jgi:hypothetical protein